jgi:hypothetical protein
MSPQSMSLPNTSLPAVILDTILDHLARLFLIGAKGNEAAARDAAVHMLAAYNPETEDELRLAANIISFSFHALEALGQATTPDMAITRILRLRGSAVSLSRESHKAERRLDQIRNPRQDDAPTDPEPVTPNTPQIDKALDLIADTRAITGVARQTNQTWTQAYRQRQREKSLARRLAKAPNPPSHSPHINVRDPHLPVTAVSSISL